MSCQYIILRSSYDKVTGKILKKAGELCGDPIHGTNANLCKSHCKRFTDQCTCDRKMKNKNDHLSDTESIKSYSSQDISDIEKEIIERTESQIKLEPSKMEIFEIPQPHVLNEKKDNIDDKCIAIYSDKSKKMPGLRCIMQKKDGSDFCEGHTKTKVKSNISTPVLPQMSVNKSNIELLLEEYISNQNNEMKLLIEANKQLFESKLSVENKYILLQNEYTILSNKFEKMKALALNLLNEI